LLNGEFVAEPVATETTEAAAVAEVPVARSCTCAPTTDKMVESKDGEGNVIMEGDEGS